MTQTDLASKLAVSQSMIARWESNAVKPNADSLRRITSALDVSMDQLRAKNPPLSANDDLDEDPELAELFSQAHRLDVADRQALKAVLQALLTQARVREALQLS